MSNVIFLHTANRKCADCDCTKACAPEVMRRNPERFFFTTTEACGRCGDMVEIDNSALGTYAPAREDECIACGTTSNLVVATFEVPGSGRSVRSCICDECIEIHQDFARDREASLPY